MFVIILLLTYSLSVHSFNNSDIINKTIVCKEKYSNLVSLYGFKFINETQVQILIKNSDSVNFLIDNTLEYNVTDKIIYIINNDKFIHYGFNIFRDNLNVWAFNVTALEPLFDNNECKAHHTTISDFKFFMESIFFDVPIFSIKNNKI